VQVALVGPVLAQRAQTVEYPVSVFLLPAAVAVVVVMV
jgi:hypothetical protein